MAPVCASDGRVERSGAKACRSRTITWLQIDPPASDDCSARSEASSTLRPVARSASQADSSRGNVILTSSSVAEIHVGSVFTATPLCRRITSSIQSRDGSNLTRPWIVTARARGRPS